MGSPDAGDWRVVLSREAETSSGAGFEDISVDVTSEPSGGDGSSSERSSVSSQDADHSEDGSTSTSSEPPGINYISGVVARNIATESREDASAYFESSWFEDANEPEDSRGSTYSRSLRTIDGKVADHSHNPPRTDYAWPCRTQQQSHRIREVSQQASGLVKTLSANLTWAQFKPVLASFTADPVMREKTTLPI